MPHSQIVVQQETHAFSYGHDSIVVSTRHCHRPDLSFTALDSMVPSAQNLQLAEKCTTKQAQQKRSMLETNACTFVLTQSWLGVIALEEVRRLPCGDRLSATSQAYKTECLCLSSGLQVYSRKMAVCGSLIRRGM